MDQFAVKGTIQVSNKVGTFHLNVLVFINLSDALFCDAYLAFSVLGLFLACFIIFLEINANYRNIKIGLLREELLFRVSYMSPVTFTIDCECNIS